MAKLYAELTSDKGGRVASKGGDKSITVKLKEKNQNLFEITFKTTEHDAWIDILKYSDGTNTRIHYINHDIPY
jgi:hypothetical protein